MEGGKDEKILGMTGPVVGNFIVWAVINYLAVHRLIIFALAIMSGVLMIYAMAHFRKTTTRTRQPRVNLKGTSNNSKFVTPAQAGVQYYYALLDSCFRRNDIFRGSLNVEKSMVSFPTQTNLSWNFRGVCSEVS